MRFFSKIFKKAINAIKQFLENRRAVREARRLAAKATHGAAGSDSTVTITTTFAINKKPRCRLMTDEQAWAIIDSVYGPAPTSMSDRAIDYNKPLIDLSDDDTGSISTTPVAMAIPAGEHKQPKPKPAPIEPDKATGEVDLIDLDDLYDEVAEGIILVYAPPRRQPAPIKLPAGVPKVYTRLMSPGKPACISSPLRNMPAFRA